MYRVAVWHWHKYCQVKLASEATVATRSLATLKLISTVTMAYSFGESNSKPHTLLFPACACYFLWCLFYAEQEVPGKYGILYKPPKNNKQNFQELPYCPESNNTTHAEPHFLHIGIDPQITNPRQPTPFTPSGNLNLPHGFSPYTWWWPWCWLWLLNEDITEADKAL